MNYKLAQFILTPPQRSESTHEIFIAQPDANKEALAGKLFALIEIESKKSDALKIINFLINTLTHNYYQNEKMILRERVESVKIEHIFESALAKTNKRLAEFLQSEKIKLSPGQINVTIGVIYNDSLHFANLGKNRALLIYKNKSSNDAAAHKLADITEQTGKNEAKKPASIMKLFSNVISGAVPRGGYFIFANETFSEYLSAKQVIGIITALPPVGAAEQIKNTLGKINAYVPFLGIIIKNTSGLEEREIMAKEPAASTKSSIENLITTEETTESLLTPSGLINGKKWLPWLNNLTGRFSLNRPAKPNSPAFLLKDKIFSKKKSNSLSPLKIVTFLKRLGGDMFGLAAFIYKNLSDRKKLYDFFIRLAAGIKNFFINLKSAALNFFNWYKNLNYANKILLSAFLISVIIFFSNLTWQNLKNNELERQAAISALISAIEQKQNQIEASLLYNNEGGAKILLDEVASMLDRLPRKTPVQTDQYNAIAAKNRVQLEKISRVIRVKPTEIANFSNLNPAAEPSNLALAQGKIFSADAARKTIYSVDLKGNLASAINLSGQNVSRLDFPSADKNGNISYYNSGNFIVLNAANEKVSLISFSNPNSAAQIADVEQYNGRYYLADSANGQIYRFNKSGAELTSSSAWLNTAENLNALSGMQIDGNIYLLNSNGAVNRYAKGKSEEFSLSEIEPPLNKAAGLAVSPEFEFIYILEPETKRLAVFDKTGKFINQYTSDSFNNLKDFLVDETNAKIYFLNGAVVYSIDAVHLPQ
ncbi:MAG: hypothetical protein Q8O93_05925 [bacterium]|nr:hypothetical protein [bacterium]